MLEAAEIGLAILFLLADNTLGRIDFEEIEETDEFHTLEKLRTCNEYRVGRRFQNYQQLENRIRF